MVKVYGAGALGFGFRIWVLEQNLGGKLSRGVCKGHLYYLGLGPRAQHGRILRELWELDTGIFRVRPFH